MTEARKVWEQVPNEITIIDASNQIEQNAPESDETLMRAARSTQAILI